MNNDTILLRLTKDDYIYLKAQLANIQETANGISLDVTGVDKRETEKDIEDMAQTVADISNLLDLAEFNGKQKILEPKK